MGVGRVLFRCWQIYWAHLSLFFVVATVCVLANLAFRGTELHLEAQPHLIFFEFTGEALVGLFTLTYVPNYFDILPMYFVALLMMPLVVALQRLHTGAAVAFVLGLWLVVQLTGLSLPAEPWSDRPWFFNPFGWQLIFFTGFMLSAGWIKPPPVNRWLGRPRRLLGGVHGLPELAADLVELAADAGHLRRPGRRPSEDRFPLAALRPFPCAGLSGGGDPERGGSRSCCTGGSRRS